MDSRKFNLFPVDQEIQEDSLPLWSIHVPTFSVYVSTDKFYNMVSEKCGIPSENIILYYNNESLRCHPTSYMVVTDTTNIQIAFTLPTHINDTEYKLYYDIPRYRVPKLKSIAIKDENGKTIYTIDSVKNDTTVEMIKEQIALSLDTKVELLHPYKKNEKLAGTQFIADLFLASGVFNSCIELVSKKHLSVVNLTFLSRIESVDIVPNNITTIRDLENYIHIVYKAPVEQQQFHHRGRVIENSGTTLNDLYYEDDKNNTGNIAIFVLVQPSYIDVEFINSYVNISGDNCMQFSGMTTIKEMKERFGEITGIGPKTLRFKFLGLLPFEEVSDETRMYEVKSSLSNVLALLPRTIVFIFVDITISVRIRGEEPFSWYISRKKQTIRDVMKHFKCSDLVLVEPCEEKQIKANTRLLDIVDKKGTLVFERKQIQPYKPCNLL